MPAAPPSLRTLALGLALTGAASTAVRAQPPAAPARPGAASPDAPAARPDFEAARRHYQAAEEASARGDHVTAAREYGVAYEITRDPVMFFKIGQSFDKAGDCRSARIYYGRYVKEGNPSPDHKARAEALGEACVSKPGAEEATRKAARPPTAAPAPTPPESGPTAPPAATTTPGAPVADPPVADPPAAPAADPAVTSEPGAAPLGVEAETSWQRTAAWTSVGVALALGTTAAVLGLSAASREDDIRNLIEFRDFEGEPTIYTGPARDRYVDLVEEGERLETLSIVALAATGAAAASAALFFVLDARAGDEGDPGTGLAPTVGAGQAGLGWTGRF